MELTGQGWTVTMSDRHSAGRSVLCWRKHSVLREPRWGHPPRLHPSPGECSLKMQAGHLRWRWLASDVGCGEEKNGSMHQAGRAVPGRAKDIKGIHQTECKLGAYNGPHNTPGSLLKPGSGLLLSRSPLHRGVNWAHGRCTEKPRKQLKQVKSGTWC